MGGRTNVQHTYCQWSATSEGMDGKKEKRKGEKIVGGSGGGAPAAIYNNSPSAGTGKRPKGGLLDFQSKSDIPLLTERRRKR